MNNKTSPRPILLCFTQRNVTMLANFVRQIVPCNGTDCIRWGVALRVIRNIILKKIESGD